MARNHHNPIIGITAACAVAALLATAPAAAHAVLVGSHPREGERVVEPPALVDSSSASR